MSEKNESQDAGWHLKKEVNLSIIVSIVGLAGACMLAYTDLKQDVALVKAENVVLSGRMDSSTVALEVLIDRLRDALIRMDAKIDRLIEKVSNK